MRAFTDTDRRLMADPLFAERYRRAAAHDSRFDGAFVTAWPMSESFCRPGCASRTPRPSRVRFYRTAAAAYAAGLVPCPRCRPDMTPPAPELTDSDELGSRALRLISDGTIDRHGVSGLARVLRITPRHVLRAVEETADCGPLDYARAARVHIARLLLTATMIPMRDVATASGFATVRQFNVTVLALTRATPGAIRFGPRRPVPGEREPGPLTVHCVLPTHRPVPGELFEALARRAIPEVESGSESWFARTARLPHGPGHVRVDRDGSGRLLARLTVVDLRDFVPLLHRTERLFTHPADAWQPGGPDCSGALDTAEHLIRRVFERDTSADSARIALGGLVTALGDPTPWGTVFPTAATIARAGAGVLRGSEERIGSILRVAEAIDSGEIDVTSGYSSAALIGRHPALLW